MEPFNNIPISTKTIIAITNLEFDIEKLFNFMTTVPYNVPVKKRGRKNSKDNIPEVKNDVKAGDIITLKLTNQLKGVDLKNSNKRKKENVINKKFFRNALTVVMCIQDKMINFKVSKNGKFQITGCKFDKHAEECIIHFWKKIKNEKTVYKMNDTLGESNDKLKVYFKTVMINIDFKLGFQINRQLLDNYINKKTDYNSHLECSIGYTGCNIKFDTEYNIDDMELQTIEEPNEGEDGEKEKEWKRELIPYKSYFETLPEKDRTKELDKKRYNTFLVFYSGCTILSGNNLISMKKAYNEFNNIITKGKEEFKEVLG